MSLARAQRAVRAIGGFAGGTSHLARPPAVLEEPDVRPSGVSPDYQSIWIADDNAMSMSAFYSDIDQDLNEGDFLFTMLFVYGAGGSSTSFTESGGVTEELATLAPAAPRRAFAYKVIVPSIPYGLSWTWPTDVSAAAISVGFNRSGLDYWTLDWWDDGPSPSLLVSDYEIHLGFVVFVWSDTGSAVADAALLERTVTLDGIGVVEAWYIPGESEGSSIQDIDVTAISGDLQWVAWLDLFEP